MGNRNEALLPALVARVARAPQWDLAGSYDSPPLPSNVETSARGTWASVPT